MHSAMTIGIAGMILVWFAIQVLPIHSEEPWGLQAILAVLFLANAALVLWCGGVLAWETLQ